MVAKVEKWDSGAQKRDGVLRLLDARAEMFHRQGYVVQTWRWHGGRKLGPYYRLRYREDGRQRSVYLGRNAELAAAVKARLGRLQAPLRQERESERFWKCCRDHYRRLKAVTDRQLRLVGLRYHGNEIRGWRTANFEERYSRLLRESEKRENGAQKPSARDSTKPSTGASTHRGPPGNDYR